MPTEREVGVSSRSLKLIFRLALHHILFLIYWLRIRSSLSFWPGILIFSALCFATGIFLYQKKRTFSVSLFPVLAGFLVFPLIRLLSLPAALFPFPWDSFPVIFRSYYLLVFPAALLLFLVSFLGERFPWFSFAEFSLYTGLFALLLGREGWTLENPFPGHMVFVFILLGTGGILSLLIFLTVRSRKDFRFRKELFPILLLMGLLLIPAGRLYKAESLKEGGGLLESSLFNFDFAPFLSLESKISMKDELVFLVQKEGPPEELYLRRFILGGYSREGGFYSDREKSYESPDRMFPDYRIPEGAVRWETPDYKERERVVQKFYYINFDGAAFLGMNIPESVVPYFSWEDSSFSRIYRVDSLVSRVGPWELIDGDINSSREGRPDDEFYSYYTDYGHQEDLRLLAMEITGDLPGAYLKASAISDYFQKEYLYSLNPGTSPAGDQLRYFLFEGKKGYCSYFAFSMTLLCRSLGIPSRVVLGFWVDTQNGLLNFYPVNANQAHAWVEVYFPEYGWIEFDPTSRTLAPGEDFEFTSYNPDELEPYIREILDNQTSLSEISSSAGGAERSLLFRIYQTWDAVKENPGRIFVFTLVFLLLARVASLLFLFTGAAGGRKGIISSYRINRALLLSVYRAEGAGGLSVGELAEFCRGKGLKSFYKYTAGYQALLFSADPPDLRRWFRFSRQVRKDFSGLAGKSQYLLSILKLILFYREEHNV